MHELPIVNHMLEIVLRHAEQAGAGKITAVRLRIGELSELEDYWFIRYFDYVGRGTPAEGARIEIERVPVLFHCARCEKTFPADIRKIEELLCPFCGGKEVTLHSGREFQIKEIEVV